MKQTETTNQQQGSQHVIILRGVFSWKAMKQLMRSMGLIFLFIQGMGIFFHFLFSAMGHNEASSLWEKLLLNHGMPFMVNVVGIMMPLCLGLGHILTKGCVEAHLEAWHQRALDVAKEKNNIAIRKVGCMNTDPGLYEKFAKQDDDYLKQYEGSTHEEELQVFEYAMSQSHTFFGRFFAVLMPYSFWQKRMMSNATI